MPSESSHPEVPEAPPTARELVPADDVDVGDDCIALRPVGPLGAAARETFFVRRASIAPPGVILRPSKLSDGGG